MTARLRAFSRALAAVIAAALLVLAAQPGHGGHGGWSFAQAPAALAQVSNWVATLTGAPPAPQPFYPAEWDVVVHSRDLGEWRAIAPMQAEHGSDCGAPSTTHTVSRYEDVVFQCRDHLMTAMNAGGYGQVYLTPNQQVDFSTGEAVVKFDASTFRNSPRDWIDLWVSPFDANVQLPVQDWAARNSVHVRLDYGGTFFMGSVYRDGQRTSLPLNRDTGYDTVLTPSKVNRETFELRISRTRIRFGLPKYDLWWLDAPVADLGWSRGVVQFGHTSYNPTKCDPGYTGSCRPGTWHWDNFSISPAVPFTMIRGDQRWTDASTGPTVRFPSPAPADAHLRFGGIGDALEVSLDGGSTWVNAQRQATSGQVTDEHFKTYWMPIPAGTTRVDFRGRGFWGGPWMVRDVSIWSQTGGGAPPPPPAGCSGRPAFVVRAQPATPGVLRVTVAAGTGAGAPNNSLRAVRFGQAANASIEVPPRGPVASGATLSPAAGTREMTFVVSRAVSNASTTVPLTLVDDCGEWQTFVGGGPAAF